MKNFTLMTAALLTVSTVAMAQSKLSHRSFSPLRKAQTEVLFSPLAKQQTGKPTKAQKAQAMKKMLRTKTRTSALYLPQHEDAYYYEDGEWLEYSKFDITYDGVGNILSEIENMDEEYTKTEYTYNTNNKATSKLITTSEDGETYENSEKQEVTYDTKVTDLITESAYYYWQEAAWTLVNNGYTYKRTVTRDAKGNITNISIALPYQGKYEVAYKYDITYDANGVANEWKEQYLKYDTITSSYVFVEGDKLKNIVWDKTNGQITASDFTRLLYGDNRITSADIYSDGVKMGSISVTYDTKGGYNLTIKYEGTPLAEERVSLTYTDNYGSYEVKDNVYKDANKDGTLTEEEVTKSYYTKETIDAHGNTTLYEDYIDNELETGEKYEYTYNDTSDYPTQYILSEYDSETGEYAQAFKVVSSQYVDVTGIKGVAVNDDDTAATTIYNANGVALGSSFDALPKGLYIVKQGAKTQKVIKK